MHFVFLLLVQIDIDRDHLLRQNPGAYTKAMNLAVRGLHRCLPFLTLVCFPLKLFLGFTTKDTSRIAHTLRQPCLQFHGLIQARSS